ncbi:MAG: glucose 1-dehydrogenase [Parvularculales bacterium]
MVAEFNNKVAVVTGAARGLGAASARGLAAAGAQVILTDVLVDEGEVQAGQIRKTGAEAVFVAHDVTHEPAWEAVMSLALEQFGRVDIVVNNAGVAPTGKPLDELALDEWQRVIGIDLDSVFLGCKHAFRAMKIRETKETGGGSIINISSIMGLIGMGNGADYNAAKGGVRLLTKVAALEGAPFGIRVNSIHPGFVDTSLVRDAIDRSVEAGRTQGGLGSANEVIEMLSLSHPIGHLGVPDDIASAVVFLAGDGARFMTGSEMVVDGGYTAQ